MKSETTIARFYLRKRASMGETDLLSQVWRDWCNIHKATLQRFLEFFEGRVKLLDNKVYVGKGKLDYNIIMNDFDEKITDIKNAIKLYDESEI